MTAFVNVVVVGAGAAGLAAASTVEARGLSCQVLEAQAQLGGRVSTVATAPDGVFDRGAQMINGDMSAVLDLARGARLACAAVPQSGRDICVMGDEVLSRATLIDDDEIYAILDTQVLRWDSPREILRAALNTYQWWTTPWDSADEARRGITRHWRGQDAPKGSLAAAIRDMLLCEEDEALVASMFTELCSAAPALLDVHAVRALFETYASDRDDLEFQFPGGMAQITQALADQLVHTPQLNAPVTEIRSTARGVEVISVAGVWQADHVIVAVPPPVAQHITFITDAHDRLQSLLTAFAPGDMIKTALRYERAFWRLEGLSGAVSFGDPAGLQVVDTSLDNASPPCLTAFLGGPEARSWAQLSAGDRQNRLLGHLRRAFGDACPDPIHVSEAIWVEDRWCGGGYNATVRLGHCRDAAQELRCWPGPIRFAGAELSAEFAGYVEGAIRSGRRAAETLAGAQEPLSA